MYDYAQAMPADISRGYRAKSCFSLPCPVPTVTL